MRPQFALARHIVASEYLPMGKRVKKQIPLYLDADCITALETLRRQRGCTMQDLLRRAIDTELRGAEGDGAARPPTAPTVRATSTEPRRFTIAEVLARVAAPSPPGANRQRPSPR